MPKRKKKSKIKKQELYVIAGMLALIAIMLLAIFLKPETLIRFESSSEIRDGKAPPETVRISPPLDSDVPRESASIPLQGSFTELFSGVGWKNPLNSNVHQDFKTLTISFPPAYSLEESFNVGEVQPPMEVEPPYIEVGGRRFTAKVEKVGEQYKGHFYEVIDGELVPINPSPIFSSQYSGKIVFGSDKDSKIFLLYAAYQGKAFEVSVGDFETPKVEYDYSAIFNARVTEEDAIDPQVFYKSGAWWIFSASDTPKLLRIRGGMASDLTENIGLETFTAVPAPEESTIYLISGDKIFRLRDFGFRQNGKLVWESLRLNAWEGEIVRGRFTRIDAGGGGNIKYFLSNDGGRNWTEVELNRFVQFNRKGGDFRWRAELEPSDNQYESPWIKTIGVEYYIVRK